MKTLFSENYRHTENSLEVAKEFDDAIDKIFEKYVSLGYSPREIAVIAYSAVSMSECRVVLIGQSKNR